MNRTIQVIFLIVLFSVAAALVMHFLVGFSVKKASIIAGGAGAAMILFDVIIPKLRSTKLR